MSKNRLVIVVGICGFLILALVIISMISNNQNTSTNTNTITINSTQMSETDYLIHSENWTEQSKSAFDDFNAVMNDSSLSTSQVISRIQTDESTVNQVVSQEQVINAPTKYATAHDYDLDGDRNLAQAMDQTIKGLKSSNPNDPAWTLADKSINQEGADIIASNQELDNIRANGG